LYRKPHVCASVGKAAKPLHKAADSSASICTCSTLAQSNLSVFKLKVPCTVARLAVTAMHLSQCRFVMLVKHLQIFLEEPADDGEVLLFGKW
jgi:hypothetical protein